MSARFRHSHAARAGLVSIAVQPGDGRISETFVATESEMRRFAWSLLADIDPDEVPDIPEKEEARYDAIYAASGTCECGRSLSAKAPGGKTGVLLRALASGPLGTRRLAELIDRPASNASALINDLYRHGLVERTNGGGRGVAAVWRITAAGRLALLAATPAPVAQRLEPPAQTGQVGGSNPSARITAGGER